MDRTYNLCKLSIEENTDAFTYVINPSNAICTFALQRNGCLIKYVKNPTAKLCKLAIEQNINAFYYIKNLIDADYYIKIKKKICIN